MSIYVKNPADLVYVLSVTIAKPYLTLKEAEFDKQLATYS